MNVLLIYSEPDPKRRMPWHDGVDALATREVLKELAKVVNARGADLVVNEPEVISRIDAFLPASRIHIIERGADPVLTNVAFAVLIAGGDEDLALARRVHASGTRVLPAASSGAAAAAFRDELADAGKLSLAEVIGLGSTYVLGRRFGYLLSSKPG